MSPRAWKSLAIVLIVPIVVIVSLLNLIPLFR